MFLSFRSCLCLSIFALLVWVLPSNVQSAFNAYDVLGQYNVDGSPNYTNEYYLGQAINSAGLKAPYGGVVDTRNHRLYIADSSNGRILVYNLDSSNNLIDTNADYVIGAANFTSEGTISSAGGSSIAIDEQNGLLFFANANTTSVYVYDTSVLANNLQPEYVIGQADFNTVVSGTPSVNELTSIAGITYDSLNERLFVSDIDAYRILVFDLSNGITNGMDASYVLGQPDFDTGDEIVTISASTVSAWALAFATTTETLYATDSYGYRVLVFDLSNGITNNMDASYALGQSALDVQNSETGVLVNRFSDIASGIVVNETLGHLYISDYSVGRILVFNTPIAGNGINADYVLGQDDFTSSSNTDLGDHTLFYGGGNILYAASVDTNRVLAYDTTAITNGESPVNVIGQTNVNGTADFSKTLENNSNPRKGFSYGLYGIAVDTVNHRLFVSDQGYRILVFNLDSTNQLIDKEADYVIGQEDFNNIGSPNAYTADTFGGVKLIYDSINNRLFVADTNASRVLVFDLSNGITNGMDASYVLGQDNFTSRENAVNQSSFYSVNDIAYDEVNQRLFVSDSDSNGATYDRIAIFDLSGGITNGMNMSWVLGPSNFTSSSCVNSPAGCIFEQQHLYYDKVSGYLYTAQNARLAIFDVNSITNGENAIAVLGQPNFTSSNRATSQSGFSIIQGIAMDEENRLLFVSDGFHTERNNRIMIFDINEISNGENAISVIGRTDFTDDSVLSLSRSTFNSPADMYFSSSTRTLYVNDTSDGARVLLFSLIDFASDTLSQATAGIAYSHTLTATSSQGTVTYSLVSGTLPDGLSLNESTGAITGTPTTATTSLLRFKVTDTLSAAQVFYHSQDFTLTVNEAPAAEETPANPPANGPVFISSGGGGGFAFPGTVKNYIVPNQEVTPVTPPQVPTITTPSTQTPTFAPTNVVTSYSRNLALGNGGEDVRNLQKLLNSLGFTIASSGPGSPGKETTYYGELTRNAVKRLQEANREAILTPSGLTSGTGYFGPATRRYLEGLRF